MECNCVSIVKVETKMYINKKNYQKKKKKELDGQEISKHERFLYIGFFFFFLINNSQG